MPYIKQERRDELGAILNAMAWCNVEGDGDLNYILYAYCKKMIPKSYNSIKNYCAELRACATEIERRILAPYEENKIEENGDI